MFNIPKDLDRYFFFQFLIFYLISFFLMSFSNGQSTIIYIDEHRDAFDSEFPDFSLGSDSIDEYKEDLIVSNVRIQYVILFLYWVLSPFVSILYAIFFMTQKFINHKALESVRVFLNANRINTDTPSKK